MEETASVLNPDDMFELRLFLEELLTQIFRSQHSREQGIDVGDVRIRQEVPLDGKAAFADVLISVPDRFEYIVEVDWGYDEARLLASLTRKYQTPVPALSKVSRLVVAVESCSAELRREIERIVPDTWSVEIWDNARLVAALDEAFGVKVDALTPQTIQKVRDGFDYAQGRHAFGDDYANTPLEAALLWQFGHWRLRELYQRHGRDKRAILRPARYANVAVLFADLTGFSGYVRDTPRSQTIRDCLEAFCSKSRYQVINDGGMLYQFLGDAVIGLFGLPDGEQDASERCFDCARSLLSIGDSISNEWQRQLDRLQPAGGAHVGMAMGKLDILSLRPFSRTHMGAIGDTINMARRLSSEASSGQIVASNSVYQSLSSGAQSLLEETPPIEARNVGLIRAFRYDQARKAR